MLYASPNKYIPPSSFDRKDVAENLGREVRYEPTVIFTPVLTSSRNRERRDTKTPLLTEEEVSDISEMFKSFGIANESGTSPDEDKKPAAVEKKVFKKKEVTFDNLVASKMQPPRRFVNPKITPHTKKVFIKTEDGIKKEVKVEKEEQDDYDSSPFAFAKAPGSGSKKRRGHSSEDAVARNSLGRQTIVDPTTTSVVTRCSRLFPDEE